MKKNKALRNSKVVWETNSFNFTNTGQITDKLNELYSNPEQEVINVTVFRNGTAYTAMIVSRQIIDKTNSKNDD